MDAKLKFEGGTGSLTVDGIDISNAVTGVSLSARSGQPPLLLIETIVDVHLESDVPPVVTDQTREALIALGWIPPADEPTPKTDRRV